MFYSRKNVVVMFLVHSLLYEIKKYGSESVNIFSI